MTAGGPLWDDLLSALERRDPGPIDPRVLMAWWTSQDHVRVGDLLDRAEAAPDSLSPGEIAELDALDADLTAWRQHCQTLDLGDDQWPAAMDYAGWAAREGAA